MNREAIDSIRTKISARSPRHQEIVALMVILTLALIVRVALASLDRVIRWDEPDYLTLGINLFTGRGYTTGVVPELHYTPLLPIVTGLLYLCVHKAELASNIVYIVTGTLLLLPIYAIARRVYGQWTAIFTVCLLAVYPPLTASVLYWGTMSEPLYILLVYGGFYFALTAVDSDSLGAFALAGVFFSLAYLTRPEASITFLLIGAYLVVVRLAQGRLVKRSTVSRLAVFILAFILVAAPYLGFLYAKSGRILLTGKLGLTYAMGQTVIEKDPAAYDRLIASLDESGTQIVWYSSDRFKYSVLDDFLGDPVAFVHRMVTNARILAGQLFSHTVFSSILGVPVFLGLMAVAWDRQRLQHELLLATVVAAPLLAFLPFHIEIRFFAPTFPVLLMWVAHGLAVIGRWLSATWDLIRAPVMLSHADAGIQKNGTAIEKCIAATGRGHVFLVILPLLVVLVYFAIITPGVIAAGQRSLDWTHKQAGLWMKDNTEPGAIIMTRDLSIAVYAQRPWIPSPNAEYDKVMAYARHHHAKYYVVDEYELTTLRPQLQLLLDEHNPPPGLKHEETFTDGKRRTIIYRLP